MNFFNYLGEWSPGYKLRLWTKLAMWGIAAFAAAYIGIRIADAGAGWALYAFFWIIAVFAMIRGFVLVAKLQELWEHHQRLREHAVRR